MELGKNILNARKKKGLSQEELGEVIGVTRQTISNWELGETGPNPEQLKLLSKELGISVDELLDNDIQDILVKKISNTEKISKNILNIFKIILITMIFGFVFLVIIKIIIKNRDTGREMEETIHCSIYGEEHGLSITYQEYTGIPLVLGGDSYFIDILELSKYNDVHQIFNVINDYVKKNGGTCVRMSDKDLNDLVNISIKEGTLTKEGVTILITEKIDYDLSYGEEFWLQKYNYSTSSYEKLENNTGNNCGFNMMAYKVNDNNQLELKQDWSCMHGKLDKGIYRLVKKVFFDSDIPVIESDFYNIWVEFEIE